MREGGREGRGVSLTLWEVLEDSGDAALGEQENVAVPHCATAGDIVNQVDLGREGGRGRRERERERGGGGEFLWFLWLRGKPRNVYPHEMFTCYETVPHSTGMWFSILQ